jgi:tRNA1Val (adenine37-N6)-methyltransferase
MKAKTEGEHFTGLELQPDVADMASRSVAMNGLEGAIDIICGDLKNAEAYFAPASFDVITCNPPYMIAGDGLVNPEDTLALARHEVGCTLDDVLVCVKRNLKAGGRFYMVHRPFRLAEILKKMSDIGLEPKALRMVYPYVDREPNMVLIEGLRGGKSRITVEPPLIVYEKPGVYTPEIYDTYGY